MLTAAWPPCSSFSTATSHITMVLRAWSSVASCFCNTNSLFRSVMGRRPFVLRFQQFRRAVGLDIFRPQVFQRPFRLLAGDQGLDFAVHALHQSHPELRGCLG